MRALILAGLLVATRAHADKPTLVALAPAADARRAVPIGPAGQVYDPDGKGAWIRHRGGGVAEQLVAATTVGTTVIAAAKGAPAFKLKGGAWTSIHLELKGNPILGTGSRVLAAIGKNIYALDRGQPAKLAEAPAPVLALAATATGVIVATPKGLMRLEGIVFKPIKKAPKQVNQLVSDRWALVDRGALDLKTMKTIAWPAGMRVGEATTLAGDTLVAVAVQGKTVELLTVRAGKLEREKIPLDQPKAIIGLAADKAGRVVVACGDGRLAVRDGGVWTITEVRDELPVAKPGPAPAVSK